MIQYLKRKREWQREQKETKTDFKILVLKADMSRT